ncbi:MAG: retropepsin-like aspartic protease [Gemmatimonadota bacterium]|nr:retropepsin-like aspartic protease [Gemmatimonadota bacterium]
MPYFTRPIDPQKGLILNAIVGVSKARLDALESLGKPVPDPVGIEGLVDTGANRTCVTPEVVEPLNLTPGEPVVVHTPSGSTEMPTYDIGILIFSSPKEPPFRIPNIQVMVSKDLKEQNLECLIGLDILSNCLLTYDGKAGLYTLAF